MPVPVASRAPLGRRDRRCRPVQVPVGTHAHGRNAAGPPLPLPCRSTCATCTRPLRGGACRPAIPLRSSACCVAGLRGQPTPALGISRKKQPPVALLFFSDRYIVLAPVLPTATLPAPALPNVHPRTEAFLNASVLERLAEAANKLKGDSECRRRALGVGAAAARAARSSPRATRWEIRALTDTPAGHRCFSQTTPTR